MTSGITIRGAELSFYKRVRVFYERMIYTLTRTRVIVIIIGAQNSTISCTSTTRDSSTSILPFLSVRSLRVAYLLKRYSLSCAYTPFVRTRAHLFESVRLCRTLKASNDDVDSRVDHSLSIFLCCPKVGIGNTRLLSQCDKHHRSFTTFFQL